jgi:hypothetical protein
MEAVKIAQTLISQMLRHFTYRENAFKNAVQGVSPVTAFWV